MILQLVKSFFEGGKVAFTAGDLIISGFDIAGCRVAKVGVVKSYRSRLVIQIGKRIISSVGYMASVGERKGFIFGGAPGIAGRALGDDIGQ